MHGSSWLVEDILASQGLCCISNKILGSINGEKFLVYLGDCQLLKATCITELNNIRYTEIMPTVPVILWMQIPII
jgi:hypothetical protein